MEQIKSSQDISETEWSFLKNVKKVKVVEKSYGFDYANLNTDVSGLSFLTCVKLILTSMLTGYASSSEKFFEQFGFFMKNFKKLISPLLNVIVPALMLLLVVTNYALLKPYESQVAKISMSVVFYFALMFVWMTTQIVFTKVGNFVKAFALFIVKHEYSKVAK